MDKESKDFLRALLSQCAPSGYEEEIQQVWLQRTKRFADKTYKDVHGNAFAVMNPKADFRVMLAGHCDEIGFIITFVTDTGFLYFEPIGGIDGGVVPGTQVVIKGKKGSVHGVIGRKAIHMMTQAERKTAVDLKTLYIDIGAKSKADALKSVSVGDAVVVAPNFQELAHNCFTSKACDNRTGAYVVSEVLKLLHKQKSRLKCAVYSVSTVQEEVGLRGAVTSAFGISPAAAIAVDVGHATDTPDLDPRLCGEFKLGGGPIINTGPVINTPLRKLLVKTAQSKKIPYQLKGLNRPLGTDTGMIQISKGGVATALVNVPNRYMHTPVEVCSMTDIQNVAKLIAATIFAMKPDMDFIPR